MATSKTKKISLVDQMDLRKSKNAKPYANGGPNFVPQKQVGAGGFELPEGFGDNSAAEAAGESSGMANAGIGLAATGAQMIGGAMNKPGDRPNVGGMALSAGGKGASIGASVGSIIPGVGTGIGAGIGFVGGATVGAIEGSVMQNKFDEQLLADRSAKMDYSKSNSIYNSKEGYNQYNTKDGGLIGKMFANGGGVGRKDLKSSDFILNENNSNNYNYPASQGSEGGGAGSGYKKGGKIHIKPENKGKFTASAKAAGEGVQEHAHNVVNNSGSSETQRKRAQFAINAKKWNHADGGETLAKVNDMSASNTKPSLMHWMSPSWLPGHMFNGGETGGPFNAIGTMAADMLGLNSAQPAAAPAKIKPNTDKGGVSVAKKDGAAIASPAHAYGGQISPKSKITAPQGTYVDHYVDNLPHEGQVRYEKGGQVRADYGVIPGNGNPKADDKNLMADQGGFVVPAERVHKVKPLLAMAGYDPNAKLAMSKGGEAPIRISSKELYMNPDVKEDIQEAAGMGDEDLERELSPNSPYNKHHTNNLNNQGNFANGGPMKKSPVSMDENFHKHQRRTYEGGGNMGYANGSEVDFVPTEEIGSGGFKLPKGLGFKLPATMSDVATAVGDVTSPGYQLPSPGLDTANPFAQKASSPYAPAGVDSETGLPPYANNVNQYDQYNKVNNAIAIGEGAALAGSTLWNAMQKYKPGPPPTDLSAAVYERNFEAERGAMDRAATQAGATARYTAREQNQTAATNVGLAANQAEQKMKIAEVIGDKQEGERARVADKKLEIGNFNIQQQNKYKSDTAQGAMAWTQQKGNAISSNISQMGNVATNFLNTKLGIGGIQSAEKATELYTQAYADLKSGDPARVKRARSLFDGMDLGQNSLPLRYSTKNPSKDYQNFGGQPVYDSDGNRVN
jgi:hypothetical protein